MKNILIGIIFCVTAVLATSCEKMFGDFLDKAPGVDVTEDTIFSSQSQVETFLAGCYEMGMHTGYPYMRWLGNNSYSNHNNGNAISYGASCDEGEYPTGWYPSNTTYNVGNITASNVSDDDTRYSVRWMAIRMINTMLERVDGVPNMDQAYKDQIKGEVRFLRALNYFEMFKRFGGVPVLERRLKLTENDRIPRASLDSTLNFIIKDCDYAASVCPDIYPSTLRGRITKGAALALKAKALLYAASPLFNTGTPYMSMTNPDNNRLICFGDYDANRWKLAADAAKAVLDWAPNGGVALVTDAVGGGPTKNYKYVWEKMDNQEIILSDKLINGPGKTNNTGMPFTAFVPSMMGGWGGVCPLQGFIEKFYDKTDGTPQTWAETGNDLNLKYSQLDPRFAQTIGYNNSYWSSRDPVLEMFQPNGKYITGNTTGYWLHKWIPENHRNSPQPAVNWTHFRLAEIYLNYAEALNEFYGPTPEAYAAVNVIRSRSGMPPLPAGLSKDEFRERVHKERGIELAWEDHRIWDIKRWMIAESTMQGPVYGLKITKVAGTTPQEYRYEHILIENRVWYRRMYLNPFTQGEVNKGYLVQNPGY